jgi:hypothetical protein
VAWRWIARTVVGFALGAFGCSSGSGARADAGGADGGSCAFADSCVQVPLARVAAACGTIADATRYDLTPAPVANSDICSYTANDMGTNVLVFEIDRACFADAATARLYFDTSHDQPLIADTTMDEVSGLGDAAFFRFSAQGMRAQLNVLYGNRLAAVVNGEVTDGVAAKACMTALARDVLATH